MHTKLVEALNHSVPNLQLKVSPGGKASWIDIENSNVVIEVRKEGFGVSLLTEASCYGEGPDIIIKSVEEAVHHVLMLLKQEHFYEVCEDPDLEAKRLFT